MAAYRFPYADLPSTDVVTLRHLVEDYVGHIHHHFKQIRRLLVPVGRAIASFRCI
jgi:hypothetical protein